MSSGEKQTYGYVWRWSRLAFLLAGLALLIFGCSEESSEPDATRCFSPWDGNHREFTDLLKSHLNDPGSLEVISTKWNTQADQDGRHFITMEFTAKNALGGRVREKALGFFHGETCEAILIGLE